MEDREAQQIWTDGVDLLVDAGGKEREVRALLGKLAKRHGRPQLARAIVETQNAKPADPRSYLIGVLTGRDRMHVGRSDVPDDVQPDCTGCNDLKTVWVKKPDAEFEFETIQVPCPACTVPKTTYVD